MDYAGSNPALSWLLSLGWNMTFKKSLVKSALQAGQIYWKQQTFL
jgi:hypothetical protein